MSNIIAVYNFKGGVGKTSTTLNLAHSWSKAYKVLVIDCDPQCNLSQSLYNKNEKADEHNLYLLTSKFLHNSIPEIIPLKINPYLDLIHGDFRMNSLESNNQFISFGQTITYGLLSTVRNKYDLILLDFPTHFGVTVKSFIANIDSILIPAIPDSFSNSGFKQLLTYLAEIQKEKPIDILGIFFNQFKKNTLYHQEIVEKAEKELGTLLLKQKVRESVRVSEAHETNKSIYALTDERSNVATDFMKLSEEVIGRLNTYDVNTALEKINSKSTSK
ncbi:MAG: ParA family protein [Bacteroidota bacterium]